MKIEFLLEAKNDLDDAYEFYEYEQKGLGKRFIIEVKKGLDRIDAFPFAWQSITKRTRRCLIKSFSFSIIYLLNDDVIVVVAIASLHRMPNYWNKRISETP